MSRAAKKPTLPQDDSPREQKERDAQLAKACESYVWTTAVTTLPGVPLATKVPFNDEPTIEWFGLVAEVAAAIAVNVIAVKLAGADRNVSAVALTSGTDKAALTGDADTSALNRDLLRCKEIQASVAEIRAAEAPPARTGLLENLKEDVKEGIRDADVLARGERLRGHIDELRGLVDRHAANVDSVVSQSDYNALFATLQLPAIASTFTEDSTFALLRVAGPNPMLLTGIDKIPDQFPVSAEHYRQAMGDGDSLDRALGEGRVYMLDYAELDSLVPGAWQGLPKFPYSPMALFAVPVGGASLQPVAIQCGQDPARCPIFTPGAGAANQWGWQIAKTVVQVADGNYHELFVHLARTHLVMEAFAVATWRQLADVHPLWALLTPHFEGSLFINNAAATSLIAPGGPIDQIFAGTITSTQSAAAADRLAFDFYGKMPPNDLAARRVADPHKLPNYPYRDDALLVWKAIRDWAEQYIGIYYADDDAVTGDTELAAWATSLASDGKLKGFKAITTREQLVDVCAMVMFTGSAQHAAVNFPQRDIMTYGPAVTGAGWQAAPAAQADHTKPEWLRYMLPIPLALEQLNTLYLLGSVHYRPLGDYRSNDLPYPDWFRDPAVTENALPRFQSALKEVETRIVARNRERLWPYPYLQPSLIPTSINI